MSCGDGGPPPTDAAGQMGPTPTLNNLLSSKSSLGGDGISSAQNQDPTQNGGGHGSDRYAATAAAVAAGAGTMMAMGKHPQLVGLQQHEWQQPRSPSQSGSTQDGVSHQLQHPHSAFPPAYPPQFMHGRSAVPPGYPGYPHGYPVMPGQGHHSFPGSYQPQIMRPPQQDLVRMPHGPSPAEWVTAQQQKLNMKDGNPATPVSVPAPSPAASSIADESLDDKSRLESPSWSNPNHGQRTPIPPSTSQMHPGGPPAGMMMQPGMLPGIMQPGMMPPALQQVRKESIVDKLVGPPTPANPPRVMPERRAFFERLVAFCEQHGDPITMIPQVSKQNVDLHRLYIAVRNRGGFEQVTKDKAWKAICSEANPDISESSAAGYQLRKHYQKHLLLLECVETGRNAEEAVAFADKLKRQRRKDNSSQPVPPPPFPGAGPPGPPPSGGFPPNHPAADPNLFYQQQQQQIPHGATFMGGAPPVYPGGFSSRLPHGTTSMRAPLPQPHMLAQSGTQHPDLTQLDDQQRQQYIMHQQQLHHHQQQQQTLGVPCQSAQPSTPGQPSSVQPATPALQLDATSQAGSRAPSTGPPASAATPDSISRMSGGAELGDQRPGSTAAPTPIPTVTSNSGPSSSQPSTSMATSIGPPGQAGGPPPSAPFYGQPAPMYPNGPVRPGPPTGYPPGWPGPGYPGHPGGPPQPHFPSAPHPAAHPAHPQHQQYLQQQMWQQRGYPPPQPGAHQMPSQPRYGYPPRMPPPTSVNQQQSAPSPGNQKMRYPPQPALPTPQPYPTRPAPPCQMPTSYPQQPPPPPVAAVSTPAVSSGPVSFSHHHQFPTGSVEATTISQKRRRKIMARDLINATPRRLIMALRSGLEAEAVWAINALNVLLYDDTNPHPSLNQMPGLLNVVVEHLWATLSVLFPRTFKLDEPSRAVVIDGDKSALRLYSQANGSGRQEVRHLVSSRSTDPKKNNFTKISRTGRKIHLREAEMPEQLKRRLMMEQGPSSIFDESLSSSYIEERVALGLGGGLAERVAARLQAEWSSSLIQSKSKFAKKMCTEECDAVVPSLIKEEIKDEEEIPEILLHRRARKTELADGPNEFEIKWPRATALTCRDEFFYRLTLRALALSNILRGFSFLPGSEQLLCNHNGLLFMLGRFLTLLAEEGPVTRAKSTPKIEVDAPLPEPEPYDVVRQKALSLLDCDDGQRLLLIDTTNQLRDDAFVMLCHMSVSLDLFDVPERLSYPIYDGLLHWCASSVPEATDPIPPAAVSPRNYCLEIMCKMSVLEHNVDMLLSTGAWPRMEKIVRTLAKMLSMSEETQNREFAIVILNALCNASEAVCYVAANQSPTIPHLVAFIETSDQSMHQVMQTHGMPALRDNPEMMGTSVGMLRRAAAMLRLLVKVPSAHRVYAKHQQRLLQFTMSQLMDSRVAGMIADTLFEVQEAMNRDLPELNKTNDEPTFNDDSTAVREIDDSSSVSNDTVSKIMILKTSISAVNGDSLPTKRILKRSTSREEVSPAKRSCLENGYEKKNGKLEKSTLKLKEAHAENGSMTVVA